MTALSLMYISCSSTTMLISLKVNFKNVLSDGPKEWHFVLVLVNTKDLAHPLFLYPNPYWNLDLLTNWSRHFYMKWFMHFCLRRTQQPARVKAGMDQHLNRSWQKSTVLQGWILLCIIAFMRRWHFISSTSGDVMEDAEMTLHIMAMLKDQWIELLNLLIFGSLIIEEYAEANTSK